MPKRITPKTAKAAKASKATKATKATTAIATAPTTAGPSKSEAKIAARANAIAERAAAGVAVAAYYSGSSLPFKAASGTFQPLNMQNAKRPSVRQAAAIAAMLIHGSDNIASDGTFTRGGFLIPANLADKTADPKARVKAQPESGVLGNMLGQACTHVSGPVTGAAQRDAVFQFDFPTLERDYLALLPNDLRGKAVKAMRRIAA